MNEDMKEFMMNLLRRISSRKFLLAVVGCLVVFGVPLSGAQITAITVLISTFIGVEGAADYIERS